MGGTGWHRQAQGIERTRHQAGHEPKQAPVQTTGPSSKVHAPASCHRSLFVFPPFRQYVSLSLCLSLSLSLSLIPRCLHNDFSGCTNDTGLADHGSRGNDLLSPNNQTWHRNHVWLLIPGSWILAIKIPRGSWGRHTPKTTVGKRNIATHLCNPFWSPPLSPNFNVGILFCRRPRSLVTQ